MKKIRIAVASALFLVVSACGGGGGGKSPAPVKTDLNVVDEIPPTPASNEPVSVKILLIDSSGNLVTGAGQLRIANDANKLFTTTNFPISAGSVQLSPDKPLADTDNNGLPDSAALFSVVVSDVDGFISSSAQVVLDRFGSQDVTVRLIPVAGSEGFSIAQQIVQPKTAELVQLDFSDDVGEQAVQISLGGLVVVKTNTPTNSLGIDSTVDGAVYIPKSVKAYDASGTVLPTESIKITVSAIRPENLASTGAITLSGVVSVSNPSAVENNAALGNVTKGAKKVRLVNLGTTQVTVSSGQSQVSHLSPSTPAIIEVEILPGALNPVTLQPINAGDKIPLWSRDDVQDTWRFEGVYPAFASNNGRLLVRAPITHFSYFSLAFAEVADGCSGTLYIRDDQGAPFAGNGVIRLESERFSLEDVYRGSSDGIVSFTDLPQAPTTLSFESTDTNGVSFVANKSTVVFAGAGSIASGIAKNVDLCKSQGTTLTARSENTDPVVIIAYKPYLRAEGRVYLNSIMEGDIPGDAERSQSQLHIPITLLNPPTNDVVLNYSFESGPGLAEVGVDFNDLNSGTVTLNAATRNTEIVLKSLPDTDIESRYKSLRMSIQKPSNAELSRGTDTVVVYSAIYDDDQPGFSNVSATPSVTEGDSITISASIDREAAGPVSLYYVLSGLADGAIPPAYLLTDIEPANPLEPNYSVNLNSGLVTLRGTITIPSGQTSAAVTIPVTVDGEAELSENLKVQIVHSIGAYMPPENQQSFNVRLIDADYISDTASSYNLVKKVVNETVELPGMIKEGQTVSLSIRLNGVAANDLSFDLNLGSAGQGPERDIWFYQSGNTLQKLQKGNTVSIVVPAGQSGAHLTMLSTRDYGVFGDAISAQLLITPPAGLGSSSTAQYILRDIDNTEIQWYILSNLESATEGLDSEFDLSLKYFSNDPTARLNLSALRIDEDHSFPAMQASDYSIADTGPYNFTGEEGSHPIKVTIVDDQLSETSEIIDLYLSGSGDSDRRSASNIHVLPSEEVNLRLVLLDNDKAVLSNIDKRYRLETNSRFKGKVSVSLETAIAFPQAVDAIISLVDAADTGIALTQATLKIPAKSKKVSLPITFDGIDPAALGIPAEGGSVTKILTVNLKLAQASIESLAVNKVEWAIAKADAYITLELTYSPEKSGPPTTGGVGSGF